MPLGSYGGPRGGWRFLMGEVPLYLSPGGPICPEAGPACEDRVLDPLGALFP